MNDPTIQLKKHLMRIANEEGMSDGDAVKVMSLTRQILEHQNLKENFGLLNFYCNWCFHTEIHASITCYRMLQQITEVFLSDDGTMPVNIPAKVSQLLSISKLRIQFIQIFNRQFIPDFLITSMNNWRSFASQIIKEIMDKPISFPDNLDGSRYSKARKILGSMKELTIGHEGLMATKLWLSDSEKGHEGQVWWCVQTLPNARVIGRLIFDEQRSDFSND